MKYPLHEVFSKFNNTISTSGLQKIKESIDVFMKFEKVDFVSVIAAQNKDMFAYEKNINLDFGGKKEASETIAKSLLSNQVKLVKKVDEKLIEFLLHHKIKPFELQFTLVFNVELIEGDVRTIMRKITLVKTDEFDNPEYVLVTFLDVTNTSKSNSVKSDVRYESTSNNLKDEVEQFRKNLSSILSKKSLLTKREIEILKVVALGKTSEEVAIELNITKSTVDTHRQNMLRKYDVSNTFELLQKCNLD